MTNETKEFAIVMNFVGDLRCNAIYRFSTRQLAEEAAGSISTWLNVPEANMVIIQTKGNSNE